MCPPFVGSSYERPRASASNRPHIELFFNILQEQIKIIEEAQGCPISPSQLFNMDDSGFQLCAGVVSSFSYFDISCVHSVCFNN